MEFEILNNEITSINYIILLFKELTDLKISLIEHVKNIEVSLINDFNKNLFDYKILLEGYHEDFKKIKLSYYKYGKDAYINMSYLINTLKEDEKEKLKCILSDTMIDINNFEIDNFEIYINSFLINSNTDDFYDFVVNLNTFHRAFKYNLKKCYRLINDFKLLNNNMIFTKKLIFNKNHINYELKTNEIVDFMSLNFINLYEYF